MSDAMVTRTVAFPGHAGVMIEGYHGTPSDGAAQRGGVVVLHHLPGFDRATKEIVRRIVELGYDTVMPNLYCHAAPGMPPLEAAAVVSRNGGVPDAEVLGDAEGAVEYLRSQPYSNGRVGVIGFCSGGRQSVIAGCSIPVDAVVDCYGGAVLRPPVGRLAHLATTMTSLEGLLPRLSAPVLGLFGDDDTFPAPDEVDELESVLVRLRKEVEFHRYPATGHSFMATDRAGYSVTAANDGWERVARFLGRTLVSSVT